MPLFRNPITAKAKLIGGGIIALLVAAALAFAAYKIYNIGVDKGNQKIGEYEQKVTDLQNELLKKEIVVRERVITKYHTRTILRTTVEYKNQDVIRTVVPEQFKLSQGWVYAHDQSALGNIIDPALAANPNPSEVSDRTALGFISSNYTIANKTADQLEALQEYLRGVGIKVTNEEQVPNRPN